MVLLETMLVEERCDAQLFDRFRARLVNARRRLLAKALQAGIASGELSEDTDIDVTVNLLIGSFDARYVSHGRIPHDWSRRRMQQIWPTTTAINRPREGTRSSRPEIA
jgi:Tetracyclin repressor-like, C-terminal domain